jgi:imidazolonepropionase-like amidohydrolase
MVPDQGHADVRPIRRQVVDGRTRLRVGWLIDGLGGPVLRDRLVELQGDRIAAIAPFRQHDPSLTGIVDLGHATLIPPLIDAHVHLSFSGTSRFPDRNRQDNHGGEAEAGSLESHWRSGILAVRDAGDHEGAALRFKQTRLKDWPYPQIVRSPGWALHAPDRYGRQLGRALPPEQGLDEALDRMGRGIDHLKLVNSGLNSLEQFGRQTRPQFDPSRLTAIRKAAAKKSLPVMVHANGAAPVRAALTAGCDSIEHGYFMGADNLSRMADQQVYWVPTVAPMAALAEETGLTRARREVALRTRDHQLNCIAKAHAMGVPIAAGTDSGSPGVPHGAALWHELLWLRRTGLSAAAAVACATSRAAGLLDLEQWGALAPGRRADFLVIEADPEKGIGDRALMTAICVRGVWWCDRETASRLGLA